MLIIGIVLMHSVVRGKRPCLFNGLETATMQRLLHVFTVVPVAGGFF